MNVSIAQSSVVKGESLYDTARTIEAMGTDLACGKAQVSGSAFTPWLNS